MSALEDKVNGYVSAMESAESSTNDDKAKFHGEAFMREEFGWILSNGEIVSIDDLNLLRFDISLVEEVRRTVTTSQWVEVAS